LKPGENAVRDAPFKRVVTGLNASGKSAVMKIGPAQINEFDWGGGREEPSWGADIWTLGHDLQRVFTEAELDEWGGEPPPAGAVFRIVSVPAHGGFELHTTDTVDFVVVLSGEVWLTLEEGEVQLTPHDCVVLTGVLHGWENRSDEPCLICGVLLSTRAPGMQ
jgi:quercetin dioxygenase-like cupin family protein